MINWGIEFADMIRLNQKYNSAAPLKTQARNTKNNGKNNIFNKS